MTQAIKIKGISCPWDITFKVDKKYRCKEPTTRTLYANSTEALQKRAMIEHLKEMANKIAMKCTKKYKNNCQNGFLTHLEMLQP